MSDLIHDETRLYIARGLPYRLQFFHDTDPTPPWEDCGAVPLVAYTGSRRGGLDLRAARGFDLLNPLPYLSDSKIAAHRETLAALAGYASAAAMDSDARAYYPGLTLREARRELLAVDWLGDGEQSESRLDAIAELWNLAGVPAAVIQSRGYSQGDWAALLVVAHPEAVKAFGFKTMRDYKKTCQDDMQNAANLWGAWCWGGVIGVEVAALDPEEWEADGRPDDANTLNRMNGETVDSWWGYYPEHDSDYFPIERNHAYAIGEAETLADYHAERAAEARAIAAAEEMAEGRPDLAPQWEGVEA